jgi:hypothetical protein
MRTGTGRAALYLLISAHLAAGCGRSEQPGEAGDAGRGGSDASAGAAGAGSSGRAGAPNDDEMAGAGGIAGSPEGGSGAGANAGSAGAEANAGSAGAEAQAGSAGAEANAGGGGEGGREPVDPPQVECGDIESEPLPACELEGCEVLLERAVGCYEGDVDDPVSLDLDLELLALTADAAYLVVPAHNAHQLVKIAADETAADSSFPLATAQRLAAGHTGKLLLYGWHDGWKIARGVPGAWAMTETPFLAEPTALYADSNGDPVLFNRTGTYTHVVTTASGSSDSSAIMEPRSFALDGEDRPISAGYQALGTNDDNLYVYRGELIGLAEDALHGLVVLAPLPPRAAPAPLRPEVGLVRGAPDGLAVGWLDGTEYTEAVLPSTSTSVSTCPSGHYGACQPDCELSGTQTSQVAAVRDQSGNAYVAFVLTTIDRTISGSFDAAIQYCNYNPTRDVSTTELRMVRVDNGTTAARTVFTWPLAAATGVRLASFADDVAIAFKATEHRVLRFRVGN